MSASGRTRISAHTRNLRVWAAILLMAPAFGWAAGTLSGTTINNSADVSYVVGAGAKFTPVGPKAKGPIV